MSEKINNTAKRQAKSPVKWFGGKYVLSPHIVELFPPHNVYVEVFGGGGHVLFAKTPAAAEVYNDLDEGVTNFFDVIRDETSCAILVKRLAATPYSRADYYKCRETWESQDDPIEKARQWFVVMHMSFGGMFGQSWSFGRSGKKTSAWLNAQRLILDAQERLATVQIENRDFRKIIKLYDTPETLFYMDPPYVPETRRDGKYRCEMTSEDHHELVDMILKMQGQAILSGYRSDIYAPLELAGYQRIEREVHCYAAGKTRSSKGYEEKSNKGQERTECIWHKPLENKGEAMIEKKQPKRFAQLRREAGDA